MKNYCTIYLVRHGETEWNEKKIIVFPMYHPAASLRNGKILEAEKADFIKLKDMLQSI